MTVPLTSHATAVRSVSIEFGEAPKRGWLVATGNGAVALAVVELQQAVSLLQAHAAAYRRHVSITADAPEWAPAWPTSTPERPH